MQSLTRKRRPHPAPAGGSQPADLTGIRLRRILSLRFQVPNEGSLIWLKRHGRKTRQPVVIPSGERRSPSRLPHRARPRGAPGTLRFAGYNSWFSDEKHEVGGHRKKQTNKKPSHPPHQTNTQKRAKSRAGPPKQAKFVLFWFGFPQERKNNESIIVGAPREELLQTPEN